MTKTYFFFILVLCSYSTFAQKKLQVGDKAPEISYQTAFPADYKVPGGKPLLLDFWATWCGPCVVGLIKTNGYTEKYVGKLDYIAITDNTSKNVESFIKKRKLTQYFVVDDTGNTFKKFGVSGLPHVFLIDAKGVIQWTGHSGYLTDDMIDEFLKNGYIKKKEAAKPKGTATAPVNVQKKEMKLVVNEDPIPGFEYSSSIRFQTDTFSCIFNSLPLKVVLEDLHDNKKRIIYKNIEPGILNKRISVVFDAIDVDVPATKSLLINNICNAYSLRAIKQEIDTSVWTVSIADHAKLKSFATVMTNKNEGYANGRGGGWSREDKTFTYVGYSLAEFIQILEKECNVICEYEKEDKDTMNYDFIEVDATDFESIRKELTGKYGLKFTLLRKKLTFLVVEKI